MFGRLRSMLVKEFIQVLRDPRMKTTIFVAPVFQMMVFGYAATTDVKNVPTAIYDLDDTPESRKITRAFIRSRYFQATAYIDNDRQVRNLLDKSPRWFCASIGVSPRTSSEADPREFSSSLTARTPTPARSQ